MLLEKEVKILKNKMKYEPSEGQSLYNNLRRKRQDAIILNSFSGRGIISGETAKKRKMETGFKFI